MDFVMVPVPEELAREVEKFLLGLGMRARASQTAKAVDGESVVALVRHLSPACRAALSALAQATVAGGRPTIAEIAVSHGWTNHQTVGVVQEIVDLVWSKLGPMVSLMSNAAVGANDPAVDWTERRVFVGAELAAAVMAADAQLADSQRQVSGRPARAR